VKNAATSDGVVGSQNSTLRLNVKGSNNGAVVNFLYIGYDFLNVLDIQLKEGRNFSPDFPADTLSGVSNKALEQDIGSIILNETAVKDLALPSPIIGQRLQWSNDGNTSHYVKVIGVVKDFHFASFRKEIKPFAFVTNPRRVNNLTVKLATQNIPTIIQQIEIKWKLFAPERPIEYFFLDETFAQLYKEETNFQKLFIVLAVLSIVIACLGLFGLAVFTAQQRTKEIGIRKVLGASVASITTMLSKDFLELIIISIVIATPLAWWAMHAWLQNYAYRIQINGWIFSVAALLSVIIAMITVSFQAIKAAIANPVKSLRTE
jgi:putative ABC transport system permease protein